MNKDFESSLYILKKNFLNKDVADLSALYAFYNFLSITSNEGFIDQVPLSHFMYADPLMESLATLSHPKMEKITGMELLPTYTYFRIYKPGDILKPHVDREACEISATVCLGWDYKDVADNYRWGIFMEKSQGDYRRGAPCGPHLLEPGDAVVYKGTLAEHWREKFEAGKESWHAQVFIHYVDKNGPYAEHIWDRINGPVNWRGNEVMGYRHHPRRTDCNIDKDKYHYANVHI
jgi:hypothetical protein|tara:strand:+ start:590 stop:1288 length:699 start_codon:yes stop_codon:yes gene_type:complete